MQKKLVSLAVASIGMPAGWYAPSEVHEMIWQINAAKRKFK